MAILILAVFFQLGCVSATTAATAKSEGARVALVRTGVLSSLVSKSCVDVASDEPPWQTSSLCPGVVRIVRKFIGECLLGTV